MIYFNAMPLFCISVQLYLLKAGGKKVIEEIAYYMHAILLCMSLIVSHGCMWDHAWLIRQDMLYSKQFQY